MKNKEAFEKWIENTCNRTCTTSAEEGWETCEEYMGSRSCKGCISFEPTIIKGLNGTLLDFGHCTKKVSMDEDGYVSRDFCCKYWDKK